MFNLRKEIGSEFWDVPQSAEENGFFPADTKWFLSGRSALQSLIAGIRKDASVKSAALPAWCCDSMIKPFEDIGIHVQFYPVYFENGQFVQCLSQAENCDLLLVMDYFGYAGYSDVHSDKQICIRDLTHSVFSASYTDTPYQFGSLRKWAGFYTGGFAFGNAAACGDTQDTYVKLRQSAMEMKSDYIRGISDSKAYLSVFGEAETMLEETAPASACERDILCAAHLDIQNMKQKRRENAAVLLEAFQEIAIFPNMLEEDCPLFVPILVPDGKRDALRRFLIRHEIYCPVHWPVTPMHKPDARTEILYRDELSLVCDQRYTLNDMDRLIETVKKFWKG
ncbi:MAG: hypothetical protein IJO13_09645 [Lachnospiraceae bacterium]|nr:hypothetical protein [Lachnospiraceae bacterium]